MSRDKRYVAAMLKKFGYRGLTVDAVDIDRAYCLTAPVYQGEEARHVWMRAALTVVILQPPEVSTLEHTSLSGWVVPNANRLHELRYAL